MIDGTVAATTVMPAWAPMERRGDKFRQRRVNEILPLLTKAREVKVEELQRRDVRLGAGPTHSIRELALDRKAHWVKQSHVREQQAASARLAASRRDDASATALLTDVTLAMATTAHTSRGAAAAPGAQHAVSPRDAALQGASLSGSVRAPSPSTTAAASNMPREGTPRLVTANYAGASGAASASALNHHHDQQQQQHRVGPPQGPRQGARTVVQQQQATTVAVDASAVNIVSIQQPHGVMVTPPKRLPTTTQWEHSTPRSVAEEYAKDAERRRGETYVLPPLVVPKVRLTAHQRGRW